MVHRWKPLLLEQGGETWTAVLKKHTNMGKGKSIDQDHEYQWCPHVKSQGYRPYVKPPADKVEKGLE